ncbi:MAG: PQQ-binding-like beta-propeller repeat protein [Acidimicrobiales bacterium]|nr:PQQ-binding-like beta-propeller repeat protein [Acidimicrobiales bacterium]
MTRRLPLLPIAVVGVLVIAVTWWIDDRGSADLASADRGPGEVAVQTDETTTTTTAPPYDGWSDPAASGQPWPNATVEGLLTFRGNPTRSFYGAGSVPKTEPDVGFRFPETGGMCGESTNLGTTKVWCGMGWTGQPTIFERSVDGVTRTWSVFGAYDGAVHFIDADTGERILPDFPTGDLIKGTVTIDPDGFPLVYTGSRDNEYRILSTDGAEAVELWSMHADDFSPTKWNDDWDSSGMVIDDHLFVGGENSQFVIVKLNRGYDAAGNVTVAPERAFNVPAWDDELLAAIGDDTVSVESSPTVVANTVYFANSGGLIQGYDIEGLADGVTPTRTFRFWTGDDTDASVVADVDGMLYVASEYERAGTAERSDVVGQLMKLDPTVAEGEDPLVWSVFDNDVRPGGMWATPAIHGDVVYAATNGGRLLGVDRATGAELWSKDMAGPLWGSPVVVDDVLLIGDCAGVFHAFDVSTPGEEPPTLWTKELGGCIEATPAVWGGRILVGTRAGPLFSLVAPDAAPDETTPTTADAE